MGPTPDNQTPASPSPTDRALELTRWRSALSPEQIEQHHIEIEQMLRSNGLAYGSVAHRKTEERPWSLDVLPMVVPSAQWADLQMGLQQRARLKQALLEDVYGDQALFSTGLIPPQVVFAHHGYLRTLRHVPCVWQLPLCNIDVTRNREGRWLATGDSCQVPEHVGYALENRLVMSQVLADPFRQGRVQRQVAYFRSLLATLSNTMDIDARCVLLGYGASHPNHFEHAYLAKYLGYTLVQAQDLTVRDQRVWLKTVSGLQRVDVILRFVHDRDADPLAYAQGNSGQGVPGLLHAAHLNNVQIINPLGVGVLDNPALDAYLEPLCQHYLQEPLLLGSAKTYWLGDPEQRAQALARGDELHYKDINSKNSLATLKAEEIAPLLDACPQRYIAVEPIDRALVECAVNSLPTSLPMTLRTYLANTNGENFEVMNGGVCLLDGLSKDPSGGRVDAIKDVWVLSEQTVEQDSLLHGSKGEGGYAILEGELPSRVADNLFWFGRYVERAENTLRNLRSVLHILRRVEPDDARTSARSTALAVQLRATTAATGALPGFIGAGASRRLQRPDQELHQLLFSEQRYGCLANTLHYLLNTTDAIRDRISYDLLRVLNRVEDHSVALKTLGENKQLSGKPVRLSQIIDQLNGLIDACAAIDGITHESFNHGDGWQFMMLGRRVERARQSSAVIASVMVQGQYDPTALENLLRNFDSVMTYRSRYRSQLDAELVLSLLLQDEANPRSIAYQFVHIDRSIRRLPGMRQSNHSDPLLKLVTTGLSRVRLAEPEALLSSQPQQRQTLKKFLAIMEDITENIASALMANYFTHTEPPTDLDKASSLTSLLDPPNATPTAGIE